MSWRPEVEGIAQRRAAAAAMGGEDACANSTSRAG